MEVEVLITTTDEGERGIDRFVGLDEEAARAIGYTPGCTKDQVLEALAWGAVMLGQRDACRDGWADLDPESISTDPIDAREL